MTLEFSPRRVIKGRNVTLRCNAQYLGRPQHPTRYSWFRDGHQIYHQNQVLMNAGVNSGTGTNPGANGNGVGGGGNFNPEWFVDHVSLETRANFTCSAYNEGGVTYSEPVYIEVLGKTGRAQRWRAHVTAGWRIKMANFYTFVNAFSSAKLHYRASAVLGGGVQCDARERVLHGRMLSTLCRQLATPRRPHRSDQQPGGQRKVHIIIL